MKTGLFFRMLLLVLLVMPLAGNVWAAPRLESENPKVDFGRVREGASVTQVFRFRNVGDATLVISGVRTSCGCTAAVLSSREIPPGEVGEVRAIFRSNGFRGRVIKTVTLSVNDPQRREVSFQLTGDVVPLISLDPQVVMIEGLVPGGEKEQKVTLTNHGDRPVKLSALRTTGHGIGASLDHDIIPPGGTATLRVQVQWPEKGVSRIAGYVLLQTDQPQIPVLRLTVRGYPRK